MELSIADHTLRQDEILVRRIASGDELAAASLFTSTKDSLYHFVLRRVSGKREDAEDIVLNTYIAAARMAPTFDGTCSALTWLCSLARFAIRDHLRPKKSQKAVPERKLVPIDDASRSALRTVHDPSCSLDKILDRMDQVRTVQTLLDLMTPDQREAVTMRYVEGFSVAEIGRITSRSNKAVERLLERAKEKPRREMLRWLGDEGLRLTCYDFLIL